MLINFFFFYVYVGDLGLAKVVFKKKRNGSTCSFILKIILLSLNMPYHLIKLLEESNKPSFEGRKSPVYLFLYVIYIALIKIMYQHVVSNPEQIQVHFIDKIEII